MFIAALFITVKMDKEECVCIYTHIHTHTHTHTLDYYSAIKRNEILLFTAMWMVLENIMLSKVRQRRTNTVSFICGI